MGDWKGDVKLLIIELSVSILMLPYFPFDIFVANSMLIFKSPGWYLNKSEWIVAVTVREICKTFSDAFRPGKI